MRNQDRGHQLLSCVVRWPYTSNSLRANPDWRMIESSVPVRNSLHDDVTATLADAREPVSLQDRAHFLT